MTTVRKKAEERREAATAAEAELAKLFAKVAADPAGSRVLASISGSLADPDFECAGMLQRGEGLLARLREAARIDVLIRRGQAGE